MNRRGYGAGSWQQNPPQPVTSPQPQPPPDVRTMPNPSGGSSTSVPSSGGGAAPAVPKKRGRPRIHPVKPLPDAGDLPTKKRGRPRKNQADEAVMALIGIPAKNMTTRFKILSEGKDIVSHLWTFPGPMSLCMLSAFGAVSTVTFNNSGHLDRSVTFKGEYQILSLNGILEKYYAEDGSIIQTGRLSVSLSSSDGTFTVFGGFPECLIAASPVELVFGTFNRKSPKGKNASKISGQEPGEHSLVQDQDRQNGYNRHGNIPLAPLTQASATASQVLTPAIDQPEPRRIVNIPFASPTKTLATPNHAITNTMGRWISRRNGNSTFVSPTEASATTSQVLNPTIDRSEPKRIVNIPFASPTETLATTNHVITNATGRWIPRRIGIPIFVAPTEVSATTSQVLNPVIGRSGLNISYMTPTATLATTTQALNPAIGQWVPSQINCTEFDLNSNSGFDSDSDSSST